MFAFMMKQGGRGESAPPPCLYGGAHEGGRGPTCAGGGGRGPTCAGAEGSRPTCAGRRAG